MLITIQTMLLIMVFPTTSASPVAQAALFHHLQSRMFLVHLNTGIVPKTQIANTPAHQVLDIKIVHLHPNTKSPAVAQANPKRVHRHHHPSIKKAHHLALTGRALVQNTRKAVGLPAPTSIRKEDLHPPSAPS